MIDIATLNKEVSSNVSTIKATNSDICRKEWQGYVQQIYGQLNKLSAKEAAVIMISEQNWIDRSQLKSCENLGISVEVGDICYIEFGRAYVYEAGYQHFGLVVAKCNGKAFVIPMTSNPSTYEQAYDPITYPCGKRHLMRIGLIIGLNRPSVLFLNDAKYINTARIIGTKAHIDQNSPLFKEIMRRMLECIFFSNQ